MSTELLLAFAFLLAGTIVGFLGAAYLVKYLLSKKGGWKFASPQEYAQINRRYICPVCGKVLAVVDNQQRCSDSACNWLGAAVRDADTLSAA